MIFFSFYIIYIHILYICTIFIIFYFIIIIFFPNFSVGPLETLPYAHIHAHMMYIIAYTCMYIYTWNIMTLSPCPEQTSDLFRAIETSSLRSAASLFGSNLENVWKIHITLMNYNFFFQIWSLSFSPSLSLAPIIHSYFSGTSRIWNTSMILYGCGVVFKKKDTDCTRNLLRIFTICHVNCLE